MKLADAKYKRALRSGRISFRRPIWARPGGRRGRQLAAKRGAGGAKCGQGGGTQRDPGVWRIRGRPGVQKGLSINFFTSHVTWGQELEQLFGMKVLPEFLISNLRIIVCDTQENPEGKVARLLDHNTACVCVS